jgi:transcriptional regulator with XRE-family HTH domain
VSPPPTLTATIMARLIAEAIEADGLTQAEFARRVGASQKHVSQVLTGKAHAYQATLDYWAFVLGRRWSVDLVAAAETT